MKEQQRRLTELQKKNEQLEARLQQGKRDFKLKLTDLNRQHQDEVQELSRLQHAHEKLKKKTEEVEALKRSKTAKRRPQLFSLDELETSVETEFDSDEENDPDWCLSSELSQVA
ncbi:hypothetical protein HPB50_003872 [Hyalomma asiaticum]|uniref:Uncharacterized protein n=1 Tax=Hyalomma asiaticum TaxID=266040 RepID=A0ACB7TGQ2_HYAAI|nr:hypothetical protein HPB50_003872 [Hyalomma asiaticum]